MVRGDQYYMAICNKTGSIAVYNPDKNLFLSPFADGPLVFNRNVEGQEILDAISKFGRSFSLVRVPFALKLLIQELQVMNIQMRIITEDNIDQLTNLSFQSRNIDKLLHIDHGPNEEVERDIKEIIDNYKKDMETKLKGTDIDKTKYNEKNEELNRNLRYAPIETFSDDNNIPNTLAYQPGVSALQPGIDSELPMMTEEEKAYYINRAATIEPPPINLFQDPKMNEAFSKLDPEKQERMLKMEPELRRIIMKQTMLRNANQLQIPSQQKEQQLEQQLPLVQPIPTEGSPDYPAYTPYDPNSPNYSPSNNPYIYNPDNPQKPDSPGYAPSSPYGGSINVFPSDPNMNAAFNMLNGESQAKILQMPQDQRGVVMKQIMLKSAKQSGGIAMNNSFETHTDSSPLVPYFTRLPMEKQAQALHGGYSSMSKEFNNLAKKVEDQNPLITLKKPVSMQDQLAGKFPMIAVKSEKTTSTSKSDDTSSSSSSDDNSKSSSSSDKSVKKIIF